MFGSMTKYGLIALGFIVFGVIIGLVVLCKKGYEHIELSSGNHRLIASK